MSNTRTARPGRTHGRFGLLRLTAIPVALGVGLPVATGLLPATSGVGAAAGAAQLPVPLPAGLTTTAPTTPLPAGTAPATTPAPAPTTSTLPAPSRSTPPAPSTTTPSTTTPPTTAPGPPPFVTSLAPATVGRPYLGAVYAGAPASGDHWWVTAGRLPAGITLSGTGILSGTPSAPSLSSFTVAVGTGPVAQATRTLALAVDPAPVPAPSPPPAPPPTIAPPRTLAPLPPAPKPAARPASSSSGSTPAGSGAAPIAPPSTTTAGYWLVTANGGVYPHGSVGYFGAGTTPVFGQSTAPVVSLTPTPDAKGYWLARSDGTVTPYGDAPALSSATAGPPGLTAPVVRLAATSDGLGYWLATADGHVFNFGDAAALASPSTPGPRTGVVNLVPTANDGGYWITTTNGAVFAYGNAGYFGGLDNVVLSSPVVAMAATPDGLGYWLATADGHVFNFGDAKFLGSGSSQGLFGTVTDIASAPDGQGYWLVTSAGGVYPFGDAAPYANPKPDALAAPVVGLTAPVQSALAEVPMGFVEADRTAAATCPGLPWGVLTAIGFSESDFGQSTLPGVASGTNPAGAAGPMQMGIEGASGRTFQAYDHPVPADLWPTVGGTTPPSPYNVNDAVFAAARDLCSNGGANLATLRQAILAYNHSDSYADQVLALAEAYMGLPGGGSEAAVSVAMTQLGVPYVWGGTSPRGFDCSGLVQWVYDRLGVHLPRTSQQQWASLPHLPPGAAVTPGDLVFFGPADGPTHVGIYIGGGMMIDAPHTGANVRIEPDNWSDYLGAAIP